MSLLWPSRGPQQARSSLRQAIMELRRLGEPTHSLIDADRDHVWLRTEAVDIMSNGHPCDPFVLVQELEHITPQFDRWLSELRSPKRQSETTLPRGTPLRPLLVASLLLGMGTVLLPQQKSKEAAHGAPTPLMQSAAAQVQAGDYAGSCRTYVKAARSAPTSKVAVGHAASCVQRASPDRIDEVSLARLASADPDGAIEVRARLAYERGDLSHVLALGIANPRLVRTSAYMSHLFSMSYHDLGEKKLGSTLEGLSPATRQLALGTVPPTPELLRQAREAVGTGEERTYFGLASLALARDQRWEDLFALYDERLGPYGELARNRLSVTDTMWMGAYATLALRKIGRNEDSARVLAKVEEACMKLAANGRFLPAVIWMTMAQHHAVNGKPSQALEEMRRALAYGWIGQDSFYQDLAQDPLLGPFRGDPAFEDMRSQLRDKLARERAQARAADLI